MKKTVELLKEYFIAIFIVLICGILLKMAETIYFIKPAEVITFSVFLKSIFCFIATYCFYSVLLLPVHVLFIFLNKILARIFVSIAFSFLILLETGLTVYFFKTGSLMGAELIIRPISEVIATITTVVSLWVPVSGIIFASILFYLTLSFLNRKILISKILLIIAVIIPVMALFVACLPKLYSGVKNPITRNYIQSKSLYCFNSIGSFSFERKYSDVVFEEERIEAFIRENPERKIMDKHYPLERAYEISNVLAPYFKKDTIKPNIVIIVLESLGKEWGYPNKNDMSFTPFFDSLASKGLYWKNCMATTKRSFGVIPAITGSLPFGVKGFQFGNMPEHQSLLKILKNNHYKTNVFYAGTFNFDAINDYLLAQGIDHMSENFYRHYEENKTAYNGVPYWGYHDSIMYEKVLQDPNFLNDTTPVFNLFVTTSGHQDIDRSNPYFQRADQLVNELIASAPEEKQAYYLKRIDRITAIFYQDLCLRDFFEHYKKRKDFEHTIFVFTGDHASGMMPKNDLSFYHVPLVIWSQLLLSHQTFPALVSHNDLVPTIEALLKEHYNLESSQYVHWLGNSLDTSSHFVSNLKTVMFDYSGGYKDMIYNNYYYDNNQLYEIQNESLDLKEIHNDSITIFMKNRLDLYRYIHKYVYLNDKLTTHPLFAQTTYTTIKDLFIKGQKTIFFKTAPQWASILLLPQTSIKGAWEKIKISVTADIMFPEIPENQEFSELIIECKGQNMQNADFYSDRIDKFIMVEELEAETWYPLHIEKQFLTDGATDIKVKMFFYTGDNKPKNYAELKNIRILIEGVGN